MKKQMSCLKNVLLLNTFLAMCSGCIIIQDSPTDTSQLTGITESSKLRNNDYREGNRENEQKSIGSISDAISACKRIQKSDSIPVACATDYKDGKPIMVFGFENQAASNKWFDVMADNIGTPYCKYANAANRQAFVGIRLHDENQGRIFGCENSELSDWFSLDDTEDDKPKTVAQVATLCNEVQDDSEIPVTCKFKYIDKSPVLSVGFRDQQTAEAWNSTLDEYLGDPFCKAANKDGAKALLIIGIENKAVMFDCKTGESSDVIDLNEQET